MRNETLPCKVGLEAVTCDVDDIHQTTHAARIDIAEVIVVEQHLSQVLRTWHPFGKRVHSQSGYLLAQL